MSAGERNVRRKDLEKEGKGSGSKDNLREEEDGEKETPRRENSLPHFRSLDDESSETSEDLYDMSCDRSRSNVEVE